MYRWRVHNLSKRQENVNGHKKWDLPLLEGAILHPYRRRANQNCLGLFWDVRQAKASNLNS
jgi:hypothetical protein